MILRLNNCHLQMLREEVQKVHPVEACGLLFGKVSPEEVFVEKVSILPNRLESPIRFEIDPPKVIEAFEEADNENHDFVGIFHSHPAPTKPSSIDRKSMKFLENAVWIILSSTHGKYAAYQVKEDKIEEIRIQIVHNHC